MPILGHNGSYVADDTGSHPCNCTGVKRSARGNDVRDEKISEDSMTRAVCLLGSPRPGGNSDLLGERFCGALEVHGASVKTHTLRDLRFQGYVPDAQRHKEEALGEHHDDLEEVLEDIDNAHILVMATPVYFCNMTGLMKQAFDRFYAFLTISNGLPQRRAPDKTLVWVQVQGEGEAMYDDILGQYAPALDMLGFGQRGLLRACNVREPGEVLDQRAVLQKSDLLARKLVLGEDAEVAP